MPTHAVVEAKLSEIEAEMKRIGMWQDKPPPAENLAVTQAFGADKLSFEQWLQFIFIPRVREIIAARAAFPAASQVHQKAFREWRMWGDMPNVDNLLALFKSFDELFL